MRLRALQTVGQACGGTAAIEFALVAPAILGLLFGTVEFGRLLWTEQALQETAIAGARCMAILQSACTAGGRYYSSANTTTYVQQVASQWGVTLQTGDSSATTLEPSLSDNPCGGSDVSEASHHAACGIRAASGQRRFLLRSESLAPNDKTPMVRRTGGHGRLPELGGH